jgi:hypothetical protein
LIVGHDPLLPEGVGAHPEWPTGAVSSSTWLRVLSRVKTITTMFISSDFASIVDRTGAENRRPRIDELEATLL